LQNGNFETGNFNGWDVVTPQGQQNVVRAQSADTGSFGARLDQGSISQAFGTLPGFTYRVRGRVRIDDPASNSGNMRIQVTNETGGAVLATQTFAEVDPNNAVWVDVDFTFVAGGVSSRLTFETVTNPVDASLDNFSVMVVVP
jgi:hypothetical protein